MIEFRRGIPGDEMTIALTRQKAWAATYRGIFPDEMIDCFDYAWHTQRDEKRLKDPDFYYYLVMDGPNCAGYFSCRQVPPGTYKDFHFQLQSLYLLPEYQGQGLGRKMMQQVFEICRSKHFSKLFWECSPHNQSALGFYAHLGAVVTEIDTGHENKQEDACYLEFYFT